MKEPLFFKCSICGNVIFAAKDTDLTCCGKPMEKLVPNTVDAAVEKHLPDCRMVDDVLKVTVGTTLHPTAPEHYIEWVYAETTTGGVFKFFKAGDEPKCEFPDGTKVRNVYSYCNLHGLWKAMKS